VQKTTTVQTDLSDLDIGVNSLLVQRQLDSVANPSQCAAKRLERQKKIIPSEEILGSSGNAIDVSII